MSFLGAQNSIALGVQGLIHIDTGGGAGGSADYLLAKSLRFRASASAYVSRTPAVSGNTNTWTWSGWVKRGTSGFQAIYNTSLTGNSNSTYGFIGFLSGDDLLFYQYNLGTTYTYLASTQLFRDYAAWYHIAIAYDDAQATASNRVKIYVNGAQITSFSTATYPTASFGGYFNRAQPTYFAKDAEGTPGAYFDGEMAEVNFVDGQALAPTAFGASSTYNQWLPIKYAGTYGTNGFYLPFTNTASTSTLVADSSGNANNWTPNNISLTAGSTYDSLTDVPTLTSTTVANYAVMNPIDPTGSTITNGNLSLSIPFATNSIPKATVGVLSGKWYWETTIVGGGIGVVGILVAGTSESYYPGYTSANGIGYTFGGSVYRTGSVIQTYTAFIAGDVIGIALDMGNGKVFFAKNNVWQGSSVPSTGTNPAASTGIAGNTWVAANGNNSAVAATQAINFGQQPFAYTPPSGFLPLNTFNIPAGTVTTSGTFTGNASTDGPFVFLNGTPTAMTINGNAVTFGTHADKLANGFKVRSSSALYNLIGSNTYVATTVGEVFKYEDAQSNP